MSHWLEPDYQRHSVEQNLDALPLLGARPQFASHPTEIHLSEAERPWALPSCRTPAGRSTLLGVHVGSGGTKNLMLKRWPLEHYLALFSVCARRGRI